MIITRHARKRAKQRLKWRRDVLDKMAQKALDEGIKHADTKGKLKKYVNKLYRKHQKANNIRIYGEVIFLFENEVLLTIWHLPHEFRKHATLNYPKIMSTKAVNKIPKPKYKDVQFISEEDFEKWLEKTTKCIVEFCDYGQDLLKIWVASNGEILHANLQQSIWIGMFIDFENLQEFTPVHMSTPDGTNWQRMMGLIVEEISTLN